MLPQRHSRRQRSNQKLRLPGLKPQKERTMKLALSMVTAGTVVVAFSLAAEDRKAPMPPTASAASRLGTSALLDQPPKSNTPALPGEKPTEKLREGTRLTDELGGFSRVGERVSFSPAGSREPLRCLENLALERISRAIDESQGQRQWVVSGLITEFRGANFLLVTKAVIQLQEGETAAGR